MRLSLTGWPAEVSLAVSFARLPADTGLLGPARVSWVGAGAAAALGASTSRDAAATGSAPRNHESHPPCIQSIVSPIRPKALPHMRPRGQFEPSSRDQAGGR